MARGYAQSKSESGPYGGSDYRASEAARSGGPAVTTALVERDFRIIKNDNDGSTGGWTPKSAGKESRSLASFYLKEAYNGRSKYAEVTDGEVPDSPYAMDALDTLQNMGAKWILENRQPSGAESKEYMQILHRAIESIDDQTKRDIRDASF